MKKTVSIILFILLTFNFIFCNGAYATSDPDVPKLKLEEIYTGTNSVTPSNEIAGELIEQGTTSQTQDSATKVTTTALSYGTSIVGTVTGIIARFFNILALQIDLVIAQLTYTTEGDNDLNYWFTIERCVFNRIALFNINYFNTYDDGEGVYEVGDLEVHASISNSTVKKSISGVYYICRFVAMTLGLLVLIYIGIRMALSTVASDKAKYKKMLISWVESIIIMFLMLYIMSIIINLGEMITGILYNIEQDLLTSQDNTQYEIFEKTVRTETRNYTFSLSGLKVTFWSIVYWCLLFMEVKFMWTYLKRFLMVGFLMIISPLITITYSIDKAGDGKAQAFTNWMKEFTLNVLIQPLHAIIYMVFVLTANNIAAESPIVAVAFFMAMGTVEKMVKTIFNMKDLESLKGLGEINVMKMLKRG